MNIPHEAQLDATGRDVAERKWVLLEFVSIAILLSVGSIVLGGLIGGILYNHGSGGLGSAGAWLAVQTATQYVNPPMAGLILAEVAVSWLSFGQWVGPNQDASVSMIRVHVRRLHTLLGYTQVVTFAVLLAAIFSALSLILVNHQSVQGVPSGRLLGADVYGFFNALGVVLLMGVGSVAARRLRGATARYLERTASEA